jgi:RNA polymerase sigma-70 factor (ECF subfamily)
MFAQAYLSRVGGYLRDLARTRAFSDEVRRRLEDVLLLPREGQAPPRIGQYRGRGSLDRFVRSVARNVARSLLRTPGLGAAEDIDSLVLPAAYAPNDVERLGAGTYEAVVHDAMRASLAVLDRRQRTILRLHLSKGITLTRIATMLQVHQSTVSRSFDAAMRKLNADVRRRLRQHGLADEELESVIRDVRSRLDLSLSRVLRDTAAGQ